MVTLKATSFLEAKDEVHRLAHAEKEGRINPQPKEGKLLSEALDQWLGTFKETLSPATVYEYESELNTFKKAFGKDRLVMEVDYDLVETVFTETWRKAKGRTILKKYGRLQTIWKWLLRKRYAVTDPISMFEPAHRLRQENRNAKRSSGRALTLVEARALIAAAKEPTRSAVVISLLTGLRRSNVTGTYKPAKRGITWGDVDMETRVIRIPGSLMKNHMDFVQPLSDQLHAFLRRRLRELGRMPAPEEQIVRPHDSKPPWKRALEQSGITGKFRWHDMRHSFGRALGAKCTDSVARMLIGHTKTEGVTPGYLDHHMIETLREALNAALPELVDASGRVVPQQDLTNTSKSVKLTAK